MLYTGKAADACTSIYEKDDHVPENPPRSTGKVVPDITWRKQDWAYEQIREWIITGELAAGEPIEQEQLAAELGISRIPLREALARLTSEGLLAGRAHQKIVVSELTIDDARDVYSGREALESVLASRAARVATADDLAAIATVLAQQAAVLDDGTPDDLRRLDRLFHHAVYASAGLPKTLGAASSLFAMSQRYVRLYLSDRSRSRSSYREHTAILDALKSHDSELAALLTRQHVSRGLAALEPSISTSSSVAEDVDDTRSPILIPDLRPSTT
jgi:DNA-binding GntR family transcriptional regulator